MATSLMNELKPSVRKHAYRGHIGRHSICDVPHDSIRAPVRQKDASEGEKKVWVRGATRGLPRRSPILPYSREDADRLDPQPRRPKIELNRFPSFLSTSSYARMGDFQQIVVVIDNRLPFELDRAARGNRAALAESRRGRPCRDSPCDVSQDTIRASSDALLHYFVGQKHEVFRENSTISDLPTPKWPRPR
ncbi:hypothetical protein K2173_018767 [Erythroxylum novogranatense]|uniref:Uncharacterized protein n=1 Tax=Erythroxylum novogranatense TaxID=1862640 RepID=A0AAV8SAP4_9ROSI|nr:hypothetical protein K2173_018767 [Erythroxylum novogranatense]